jgi:transcriptional regulator with XRE-family HTH domain
VLRRSRGALGEENNEALCGKLVDLLLNTPERVGQFLYESLSYPLVLYGTQQLNDGQACSVRKIADAEAGESEELHIAVNAPELWTALERLFDDTLTPLESPKISTGQIAFDSLRANSVNGSEFIGINIAAPTSGRSEYDFRKASLSRGIAHTRLDIQRCGLLRLGIDPADTSEKERLQALQWLRAAGSRWQDATVRSLTSPIDTDLHKGRRSMWQLEHEWLLSDQALLQKTPMRWFRDMCVLCGVSTTMLQQFLGGMQRHWNQLQNESFSRPIEHLQRQIRKALSCVVESPVRAGYGANSDKWSGYPVPVGSLFGLPVLAESKASEGRKLRVDPRVVEGILKRLFREHYSATWAVSHALRQLRHVSDAYRTGKLSREEVLAAKLLRRDGPLYVALKDYPVKHEYKPRSPEYNQTIAVFKEGTNITAMCDMLRELNKKNWHLPEPEMQLILESLQWLPASSFNLFYNERGVVDRDKAWEYSKVAHNGTLGDLLRKYREACGVSAQQLADRHNTSRQNIEDYERGRRGHAVVLNRALSQGTDIFNRSRGEAAAHTLENLWQLPMNGDDRSELRPDVVEFIKGFIPGKLPPNPTTGWVSLQDALNTVVDVAFGPGKEPESSSHPTTVLSHGLGLSTVDTELLRTLHRRVDRALRDAVSEYEGEKLPVIELGSSEYLLKLVAPGSYAVHQDDLPRLAEWVRDLASSIPSDKLAH